MKIIKRTLIRIMKLDYLKIANAVSINSIKVVHYVRMIYIKMVYTLHNPSFCHVFIVIRNISDYKYKDVNTIPTWSDKVNLVYRF